MLLHTSLNDQANFSSFLFLVAASLLDRMASSHEQEDHYFKASRRELMNERQNGK
jgi:hypothetical protein